MATQPTRARRRVVALAGVLAALFSGCTLAGDTDDGPLRALTGPPAVLDLPAPATPVTFGAVTLCTTVPGADVRLESVEAEFASESVRGARAAPEVTAWLRDVPAAADREAPALGWAPLTAVAGRPPDRLAGGPWRGGVEADLSQTYVAAPCADAADLDQPRTELLLVVTAPPAGTRLSGLRLSYRVGDDAHLLEVPVSMTVCGTVVTC